MKLYKSISLRELISIFYLAPFIFSSISPNNIITGLLASFFLILMYLGIGLLIIKLTNISKIITPSFGKLPLLLISYFLGQIFLVSLIYAFHSNNALFFQKDWLLFSFIFISYAGWYSYKFDIIQLKNEWWKKWLAIFLVMFFFYYFYFIKFTSFPLRDVFQDVHFMKGALEYSRFGSLNPFTANSYLPIIQISFGLLHKLFQIDMFHLQWFIPLAIAFVNFGCVYFWHDSFKFSYQTKVFSLIILISLSKFIFSFSNNDQLMALTLLFLGALNKIRDAKVSTGRPLSVFLVAAFSLAIFAVFYKLPRPSYWIYQNTFYILITQLILITLFTKLNRQHLVFLQFIGLIIFLGFTYHRAIIMYLPVALILWALWEILRSKKLLVPSFSLFSFLRIISFFTIALAILLGIVRYLARNHFIKIDVQRLYALPHYIFGKLIGKKVDIEKITDFAGGFTNTIIEFVRQTPPFLLILLASIYLFIIFYDFFGRLFSGKFWELPVGKRLSDQSNYYLRFFTYSNLFICFMVVSVFSGIPYVYRGQFFLNLIIAVYIPVSFETIKNFKAEKIVNVFLFALVIFTPILSFWGLKVIYNFQWNYKNIPNIYLSELFPLTQVGLFVVCVISGLIISFFFLKKNKANIHLYILILFVLVIALDKIHIVTKFYEYSYGSSYDKEGISHYTRQDLAFINKIYVCLDKEKVIFSDPYTVSILKAGTGLSGAFSIENLADIPPKMSQDLKFMIADFFNPFFSTNGQEFIYNYLNFYNRYSPGYFFETAFLIHDRKFKKALSEQTLYNNFLFIFSSKTLEWIDNKTHYYPVKRSIDKKVEDKMRDLGFFVQEDLSTDYYSVFTLHRNKIQCN